jgi:hypothetical protein
MLAGLQITAEFSIYPFLSSDVEATYIAVEPLNFREPVNHFPKVSPHLCGISNMTLTAE